MSLSGLTVVFLLNNLTRSSVFHAACFFHLFTPRPTACQPVRGGERVIKWTGSCVPPKKLQPCPPVLLFSKLHVLGGR